MRSRRCSHSVDPWQRLRTRRNTRGQIPASLLMHLMLGTFAVGIFLYNVQLNRAYAGWDIVEDAGWVAADVANKVLCASPGAFGGAPLGDTEGPRADAVFAAVSSRLKLVTPLPKEACSLKFDRLKVQPGSPLGVNLECIVDCPIPIAGPVLCSGGKLKLTAEHTIQPAGCDRK